MTTSDPGQDQTAAIPAPLRRAGSVRRTTTHDCTRPCGLQGPVIVAINGRDLLTTIYGQGRPLSAMRFDVRVDFASATVDHIEVDPPHPGLAKLCGAHAFRGFRAEVDRALPAERDLGTLRYQLLDDLPIALLLSARVLRAAGLGLGMGARERLPVDICAGWVAGGTLLAGLTEEGPPLHVGPVASNIRSPEDPLAWHEFAPLACHATRRHRRLDVWRDDETAYVDSFFRQFRRR